MSPATHVSLAATAASAAAGDGELPRQAKTRKGKRALQERGPQEHEDVKRLLLLRGSRASASVQEMLADLRDMKKPNVVYLRSVRRRREGTQQQAFHPFEDVSSGEFLCEKNSCGFFCLGSTSKKRPARLVFARMFAHQLLDMYELQVFRYTPASAFRGKEKPHVGSTPIVLLQGAHFEADEVLKGLRNFFADLFRGSAQAGDSRGAAASSSASKQQRLYLAGIDRVIAVTALEPSAHEAATAAGSAQAAAAAAALQVAVQSAVKKDTTRAAAGAAAGEEARGKGLGVEDGNPGELSAANGGQLTRDEQQQKAGGKALICLRQYRVVMKKGLAGSREPRVELEEVGPQIDMQLDRYRLADADRWKKATACRAAATAAQRKQREAATAAAQRNPAAYRGAAVAVPAAAAQKNKKKRKTTTTALGDVVGRVYVDKPDWRSLNAQKNVLLIKHNRKRAKLAAEAAGAPTAESPTAAPAKGKPVEKGGAA